MFFKSKNATSAAPEAAHAATPAAGAAADAANGKLKSPVADANLSPEELARRRERAAASRHLAQTIGDIVNLMMRADAYQKVTLGDLKQLMVPPVLAGQCLVVRRRRGSDGMVTPAGVVLWASVSPAVDARLCASADAPLRLAPDEWKSGEQLWVIDAIGDAKTIRIMLNRLRANAWSGRAVKTRVRQASGEFSVHVLQEAA